jgi:hypothetical protein
MRYLSTGSLALVVLITSSLLAQEREIEVSGVISPLDDTSFYVLGKDGATVVNWDDKTRVAIQINFRNFRPEDGRIEYAIHSSIQKHVIRFPDKQAYAVIEPPRFEPEAATRDYLNPRGMKVVFESVDHHIASKQENYFAGKFDLDERTLEIEGRRFGVRIPSGQTDILLYDIFQPQDCAPFINKANVIGVDRNGVFVASEIHLEPLGDQTALDNPDLPRYLFIGDSISGNYSSGLREALKSRFNLHHPPTNCGPVGKGAREIRDWLGDYQQKGRHWDVISFNFGHWDVGNSKELYQKSLREVITELKKTGARLIWITTCPVPNGYEGVNTESKQGKAPGRVTGVMKQYLNPWAMEIMKQYPEISICDQWSYVYAGRDSEFHEWWGGRNVHFDQRTVGKALGRFLAAHVLEQWDEEDMKDNE